MTVIFITSGLRKEISHLGKANQSGSRDREILMPDSFKSYCGEQTVIGASLIK